MLSIDARSACLALDMPVVPTAIAIARTAAAVAGIRRRKKESDRTGMYSGRKTAGNAGEEDSQG